MEKLIKKYNYTEYQDGYYNLTRNDLVIDARNPGVPLIPIILRTAQTPYQYMYNKDLWHYYHNDDYPNPEVTMGYGDGTITANALFIVALKWAYEYDSSKPNTKPVKFIDVCSRYNVRYDVYDNKGDEYDKEPYEILKNEFSGIRCDCMKHSSPEKCVHEFLIQDTEAIKLYSQILITNEITYNESYDKFVDSIDDKELFEMVTVCPQIISDMQAKSEEERDCESEEI